jgi:hypothetical protein
VEPGTEPSRFIPMMLPGGNGSAGKKFHVAGTNGFAQRYAVMRGWPAVLRERVAGK